MSTGRHAAPGSLRRGRAAWLWSLTPAVLLLAVGVVAVVCLLTVDGLGTGGRAVGSLVAIWALAVGAVALRHSVRGRLQA